VKWWTRNHSRAGGTEPAGTLYDDVTTESLPRGRDGDRHRGATHRPTGITPARAGRRPRTRPTRRSRRNHSRAGGTEAYLHVDGGGDGESLPRGRDGVDVEPHRGLVEGITPARAGRRPRDAVREARGWNHSRAGGTETASPSSSRPRSESLPRGRDGVARDAPHWPSPGITPARAGRSPTGPGPATPVRNHSRAGGTERKLSANTRHEAESLPRGRDGVRGATRRRGVGGITPARAGRSATPRPRARWWRNHSRAGGTEATSAPATPPAGESLPRGRDGGRRAAREPARQGITPARAGRRDPRVRHRGPHRNHSRAGGTEVAEPYACTVAEESLPRGRDGAHGHAAAVGQVGITPARAGRRARPLTVCSPTRNHSRAGGTEFVRACTVARYRESLPRGRDGARSPRT